MRVRALKPKGSVTGYRIVLAGLAVVLMMAMADRALAANIVVNSLADTQANDGLCTLREAILNANADNQSGSTDCVAGSGPDTITILTSGGINDGFATALPDVTSEITIEGHLTEITRVTVSPGASLTLKNMRSGRVTNFSTLTVSNSSGVSIVNVGTATVLNSTFQGRGGGGIQNCRTLRVANSTFSITPVFSGNGWAIYNGDINTDTLTCHGAGTATMSINNSTFMNGGNDCRSCLASNTAIYNAGIATITYTTIYNNFGGALGHGGGILNDGAATISNSILARNFEGPSDQGPVVNCRGVPVIDGGNNIEDAATCGFSASHNSKSNTDPLLTPGGPPDSRGNIDYGGGLKSNGGPTFTVLPCTGADGAIGCTGRSPAIDAGNNSVCMAAPINGLDQRGFLGPVDGSGDGISVCDIGAAEAKATAPPVINDLVSFSPIPSTFRTTPNTGSACSNPFVGPEFPWLFNFIARLTVKNTSPALYDLRVKVRTLTNENLLLNDDVVSEQILLRPVAGAGAVFSTIAPTGLYPDGLIRPGEFVDVPFTICLKQTTPFSFFVDVLGLTR